MNKTGKLAVIGDKDSTLAFKSIGAEVFGAENATDAKEALRAVRGGDYAVVFITEQLAAQVEDILDIIKVEPYPAVIPIPTGAGSTGFGMKGLKKDVEKAIGADILFGD